MVELNMIIPGYRQTLQASPSAVFKPAQAPAYLAQIRTRLIERYGENVVEMGGLDVSAALDLNLQKQAEYALREGVKRISPELQGALVCLDPVTGDVLAAVGGVDAAQNSINRAFASRRQPGSSIKPLIYAAALEKGITAGSIWNDTPVAYNRGNGEIWKPVNYGKEQHGEMSLRQALALSSIVVTVKLLEAVGGQNFLGFSAKTGLRLQPQNGLALAPGAEEVTLGELVQAYTPLANGGARAEARTIVRVY